MKYLKKFESINIDAFDEDDWDYEELEYNNFKVGDIVMFLKHKCVITKITDKYISYKTIKPVGEYVRNGVNPRVEYRTYDWYQTKDYAEKHLKKL